MSIIKFPTFSQLSPITQGSSGVMTQTMSAFSLKKGIIYLPATYVKFIESAGARVVPVFDNRSFDYCEHIFKSINGLVLPGGAQPKLLESNYGRTGKIFYDLAVKSNQDGDYFPLWGVCQGFELMVSLAAEKNVLSHLESVNKNLNVTLSPDYSRSKLLSSAPEEVLAALQTKPVTYNHHKQSLTPTSYAESVKLRSMFNVVSTSENSEGEEFVSIIEAEDYPFYGVQFHPEKTLFTWKETANICHDLAAIKVSQYFANFFVNEARLNHHSFTNYQEEEDALIYNYKLEYLKDAAKLDQAYFFDES